MNKPTLIILIGIAYFAMGMLVEGTLSQAVTSARDWQKVRLFVRYFWPMIILFLIITIPYGICVSIKSQIKNISK